MKFLFPKGLRSSARYFLPILILALLGAAVRTGAAEKGGGIEARLAVALKLFPDADLNKDGKLSMDEAMKYLQVHPELQSMLDNAGKKGKDGGERVSSSGPTPPPAGAAGLPLGPRVFVCSHSFMIYTATWLPPMAQAAGIAYQGAGKQMIGGSRVLQHWNISDAKNEAKKALREGRVDVLTLSPHLLLPDEGIDNFTKLGLEKNPKLRVLVQASWPARDGVLDTEFTNEMRDQATPESLRKMHEGFQSTWLKPLEKQVAALNAAVGQETVHIIPVGNAVHALRMKLAEGKAPGLTKQTELFRDALGHPKAPLAALVSYCHFAAIFQKSPIGLPVPEELKSTPQAEELNRLVQQLAWEAVTSYPLSGVKSK